MNNNQSKYFPECDFCKRRKCGVERLCAIEYSMYMPSMRKCVWFRPGIYRTIRCLTKMFLKKQEV